MLLNVMEEARFRGLRRRDTELWVILWMWSGVAAEGTRSAATIMLLNVMAVVRVNG